jgi:hypothetical protein
VASGTAKLSGIRRSAPRAGKGSSRRYGDRPQMASSVRRRTLARFEKPIPFLKDALGATAGGVFVSHVVHSN